MALYKYVYRYYYWPANGPVMFCSLVSVACRRRRRLSAGQYGYVPLRRHLVIIIVTAVHNVDVLFRIIACTQSTDAAYCYRCRTQRGLCVCLCWAKKMAEPIEIGDAVWGGG